MSETCTIVSVGENSVVEETRLINLTITVDPMIPHIMIDQHSTQIQITDNDGNFDVHFFKLYTINFVVATFIIDTTRIIEESMDLLACVFTTAELAKSIAINITTYSNSTDTASGYLTIKGVSIPPGTRAKMKFL